MKISATINRLVDKQDSSVKGFASVTMDGMFAVHGLRVMETEKGRFVNMPSTSYTDRDGNKQYSDIFHAITKAARNALNQAVLNAYDIKLQQVQATEIEVENTPDEEMSDEPADEPEPEIAMQYKGWLCNLLNRQKNSEITGFCGVFMLQLKKQIYRGDTMKKAITILAICSLLLTACGQIDDTESKAETTTAIASESTSDEDTAETSSAKEEKDTSEASTTTKKSSQTASSSSNPTGTTVTTTKRSGSSNANGNSNQGQNNSVQNNNGQVNNVQPAQNNQQQPDNSPSDNDQSNNSSGQNNRPTDSKPQNNNPSPPITTAKPAVTNKPTTTTPKPQTTVPQTEPPAPEPDNQVVDINAVSDQMWVFLDDYPIRYNELYEKGTTFSGNEFDKATAVLEYANNLGGINCIEYALNAYFLYQGAGLECGIAFASLDEWYGHVANGFVNIT